MGVSDLLDDLDVASVRLFLSAAELGSVSKAAAKHGVTQPSATARIQKLERTVGLRLLARGPTGSVVTPDGDELTSWCRALLGAAAALTEGARSLQEQADPTLRLAATTDIANHLVPQWIADDPLDGATIQLVEEETADLAATLRNGGADLGLLAGPGAPLSLRSEIVAWFDLIAVARADHPLLGQQRSVTGAQLASADLILRRRGSGTLDVIEMALAEHELGVAGRTTEVTSTAAARVAALSTGRIAILPAPAVADDLATGRLVELRLRNLEIRQPIRLAWKGSAPAHPVALRFLSSVRARRKAG
jgi:DNA-binding transcriptional LysR family regulator